MRSAITRLSKTIGELKRRKVFRVGSLYLVTIWGLSLGAAELLPTFGVPEWGVRFLVIALFLGFPVALLLAWAFEVRPEGVVVDSGDTRQGATTLFSRNRSHLTISWPEDGQTITRPFNNNLTIGRHPDNDICIAEGSVSRRHVQISYVDHAWIIEDLGSRNGTLLNGTLIEKTELPTRAEVRLSDDGPTIVIHNKDASLAETALLPRHDNR
ncbi:MAG: FHA domain-containing protein [Pseudomonadales bacterium]